MTLCLCSSLSTQSRARQSTVKTTSPYNTYECGASLSRAKFKKSGFRDSCSAFQPAPRSKWQWEKVDHCNCKGGHDLTCNRLDRLRVKGKLGRYGKTGAGGCPRRAASRHATWQQAGTGLLHGCRAAAHCGLRRDAVLWSGFPHVGATADWRGWLKMEDAQQTERLRQQTRTGRPCGSARFLSETEALTLRILQPLKRGRKSLAHAPGQEELFA